MNVNAVSLGCMLARSRTRAETEGSITDVNLPCCATTRAAGTALAGSRSCVAHRGASTDCGQRELRPDFLQVAVGSAEESAPAQQALEVEVCIVLPGVAHAAKDLDRGVADGRQLRR